MRFDLRPLRLTTGWSEPNAVVSRTLSVIELWTSIYFVKCLQDATYHYQIFLFYGGRMS